MKVAELYGRIFLLLWVLILPGMALLGEEEPPAPERELLPQPTIEEYTGAFDGALPVGESLEYKIFWSFIHVANTTVEILPTKSIDGEPAYHIRMSTKTHGWADGLYKIRDQIDSFLTPDLSRTLYYTKTQEGADKRDTHVVFNWEERQAQRTDYGEPWIENVGLAEQVYDPLGITYAFRMLDFEEGQELVLYSTDGKNLVPVDIEILGTEVVKTPLGKFECFVVEPDTKSLSGVFKKAPNASIYIWVNNEPPYVPVRLKSELHIGAFDTRLSGIEGPGADQFLSSEMRGKYSRREPKETSLARDN